jgi:hypothetical protein
MVETMTVKKISMVLLTGTILVLISFTPSRARENFLFASVDSHKWVSGAGGEIYDTEFMQEPFAGQEVALGIVGGRDRQGRWRTPIPGCEQGERYRFEADFYRDDRADSRAYPEVRIWGERFRLDTHRMYGRYQRLFVELECLGVAGGGKEEFVFINGYPSTTFWMKNPSLAKIEGAGNAAHKMPEERFFPIGVYGAEAESLALIKKVGLNTAVIGMERENVAACLSLDLHCTLRAPRDAVKLTAKLEELKPLLSKGRFAFYVNDEPGIHSFPRDKAEDIQQVIKQRFPNSFTNMAIVRPQVVSEYTQAADYFMLDQYPVPNMPMVWLSESMDEAAAVVGRGRLQSVIQAFGGENYAAGGWHRFPSFVEMNSLAFLSVVHGSRGIYFYTFKQIQENEKRLEEFRRVVNRLNSLRTWLLVENSNDQPALRVTSRYKVDLSGNPAVHCAMKEQYGTQMLMCVNTLRTYVDSEVSIAGERSSKWQDYFTGEPYYIVDENVLLRFEPLGVRVLLENR